MSGQAPVPSPDRCDQRVSSTAGRQCPKTNRSRGENFPGPAVVCDAWVSPSREREGPVGRVRT